MTMDSADSKYQQVDLSAVQDAMMAALPLIRDDIAQTIDAASPEEPGLITVRRLMAYQSQRGQAVLYLATSGLTWDAEIVLRAYYEATARILFIAFAPEEERATRVEEFWEVLGGIGERRRAVKADHIAGKFEPGSRSAAVIDVFRDPKLFATEPRASKGVRKVAEQRWSFSEIVADLGRSRAEFGGIPALTAFLHPYGMASHLIHADPTALDLMHDRATRPPLEEALLGASQMARIFTDVVGLSYLCAVGLRFMLKPSTKPDVNVLEHVRRCLDAADPILEAFYDTQTDLYRRWGRTEFDLTTS